MVISNLVNSSHKVWLQVWEIREIPQSSIFRESSHTLVKGSARICWLVSIKYTIKPHRLTRPQINLFILLKVNDNGSGDEHQTLPLRLENLEK